MSEEGKGKKKYTFKVAFISVICTLLFIIILLLFVLFGLKKCSSRTSSGSSTSYTERYITSDLDNVFKLIVKAGLEDLGIDDSVNKIYAVNWVDNKTNDNTFELYISASGSGTNFYYYSVPNARYEEDNKELVPYLLGLTSYYLDGTVNVRQYSSLDERVNTSKTDNNYVVVQAPTNEKYICGYYVEDDIYYAFPRKELVDSSDPFTSGGVAISSDSLLFDYYHFTLNKKRNSSPLYKILAPIYTRVPFFMKHMYIYGLIVS
ncbi:MAG: hypothetical protein J6T25_03500 [Bacilli bacterium]|nr:hypothetical protein [Bacilli bacterium]